MKNSSRPGQLVTEDIWTSASARRNDRLNLSYQWNLYIVSRRFWRVLTRVGVVFGVMVNPRAGWFVILTEKYFRRPLDVYNRIDISVKQDNSLELCTQYRQRTV